MHFALFARSNSLRGHALNDGRGLRIETEEQSGARPLFTFVAAPPLPKLLQQMIYVTEKVWLSFRRKDRANRPVK